MAVLKNLLLWMSLSMLLESFLGGINGQSSTDSSVPLMPSESGSGPINGSTPLCTPLAHEFQSCSLLDGRMSLYQYEQFIPELESKETSLTGDSIDIAFTLIDTFSPPPPALCVDFLRHVLCYLAAPPCDPISDRQLPICNDSCKAYNLLLSSNLCLNFNNTLETFRQSTSVIQVQIVYSIYSTFDCNNSSTYFFREEEEGDEFADNGECTSVFTPSFQEQIFARSMCIPVPTGVCTVFSETGHYIQIERDLSVALLALTEVQDNDLPSNCNDILPKLICDYTFIPCNEATGNQVAVCKSSCPIFERLMSKCLPFLNVSFSAQQLLTQFMTFDCNDPQSYLLDNVPIDSELCTDLSSYDIVPTQSPTTSEPSSSSVGGIIAAGVFVAILVVSVAVFILGCWLWQARRSKEMFLARNDTSFVLSNMKTPTERYQLTSSSKELEFVERKEVAALTETEKNHYMAMFTPVLVPYSKLKVGDCIGEGAFGKVYKGEMQTPGDREVAIKTIKNLSSPNELKAFFSESLIMKDFNHPNVLGLVGVCFDTPNDVPYIILPYMVNGSLKEYLKTKRVHITNVDTYPEGLKLPVLVGMCVDIAHGMEYLADKKFVHRDLAARNCMVSETLAIKVGDFGLARDVYSSDYYRAGRNAALPVKWMPPETLHDGISNEKTDIWSFGVTCWEVFSLGRTPYPGVQNHDMINFISSGGRLERPTLCPETLYRLFKMCWEEKPEDRPTFTKLVDLLEEYSEKEL